VSIASAQDFGGMQSNRGKNIRPGVIAKPGFQDFTLEMCRHSLKTLSRFLQKINSQKTSLFENGQSATQSNRFAYRINYIDTSSYHVLL
jgi:hypothetical protein